MMGLRTHDQGADAMQRRQMYPTVRQFVSRALLAWLLLFVLTACNPGETDGEATSAPGIDNGDEPASAALAEDDAMPDDDLIDEPPVVIWAPEFWVATEETPAGQMIESVVAQFEQLHDGTQVEIHTKAEVGAADMLSSLRSAQKVAPAVLPDVVLMDTQELWRLVELGMAQPLTDTTNLPMSQFYPFALASVSDTGELYGIPYAADLLHGSSIDPSEQAVPTNWDDLLAGQRRYLFPAAGSDGTLSLLLQYVGAGGELGEMDAGIDAALLTTLYEFYELGVAEGIIPAENASLASMEAVWQAMDADRADIVDTTAAHLLRQGEMPEDIRYAPAPTMDGKPRSIARTWAFVILTNDPDQRTLVLDLVQLLLEPTLHGQWSKFSRLLPTTYDATATWDASQPYTSFLLSLLDGDDIHAIPSGRSFAEQIGHMQTAQQAVLLGELTSAEAAASVRPPP